ncbi:PLD nuclease N-terminal domain-containing protein [Heyndrickxia sporothermodurans]
MKNFQEALDSIDWALLAPVFIIQFILIIVAIFDLVRLKKTNGPKWLWVLIILFINIIGPFLYFIIGRRQHN